MIQMNPRGLLVIFLLCSGAFSAQGQQNRLNDAQVRQQMTLAVSQTELELGHDSPSVTPRKDLEELLSAFRDKESPTKVYFYQTDSFAAEIGAADTSIAAVVHSAGAVSQFYTFEGSREVGAFSQEFNRFASSLALSVTQNDVLSLAKLFLESARAGNPGSILTDDLNLKLAVQNYYFTMYRDVWKMLDAYSRWYTQFQASMPEIRPKVAINQNGDYDLSLQTLLMAEGKHPQVQDVELTISPAGIVQVRGIRTIFPDQSRWVFYDFSLPKPETFR